MGDSQIKKYGWPTVLTLIIVYLAQGLRYFGSLAMTLYFKNSVGLSPAQLSMLDSLIVLAWYLKPIYGLLSDTIPICGYKRKSYMMISSFMGIFAYLPIFYIESAEIVVFLMILGQLSQVIADVVCDGFMIERARIDSENGAKELQRISWSTMFFASFVGEVTGGIAADYINPAYLISSLCLCPALVLVASLVIPDKIVENKVSVGHACKDIGHSLKQVYTETIKSDNIRVIIFTILWVSTTVNYSSIMTFYLLDICNISPSTLGYVSAFTSFFSFIGLILPDRFFSTTIKNKFIIGTVLMSFLALTDLAIVTKLNETIGIPVVFLLVGGSTVSSIISTVFFLLPMLTVFAKVTPKNIEATYFSFLSAIYNFSWNLSSFLSGVLMTATKINSSTSPDIWVLITISIVAGIASLVFLPIAPDSVAGAKVKIDHHHDLELPLIQNDHHILVNK